MVGSGGFFLFFFFLFFLGRVRVLGWRGARLYLVVTRGLVFRVSSAQFRVRLEFGLAWLDAGDDGFYFGFLVPGLCPPVRWSSDRCCLGAGFGVCLFRVCGFQQCGVCGRSLLFYCVAGDSLRFQGCYASLRLRLRLRPADGIFRIL